MAFPCAAWHFGGCAFCDREKFSYPSRTSENRVCEWRDNASFHHRGSPAPSGASTRASSNSRAPARRTDASENRRNSHNQTERRSCRPTANARAQEGRKKTRNATRDTRAGGKEGQCSAARGDPQYASYLSRDSKARGMGRPGHSARGSLRRWCADQCRTRKKLGLRRVGPSRAASRQRLEISTPHDGRRGHGGNGGRSCKLHAQPLTRIF